MRAFAALSVCLFHFVCTTTGYIQTQWILNFFSIGKYGVQLFFVISGFIIPFSMYNSNFRFKNLFKFTLKRLLRLEPPYITSLIIVLVILWVRDILLHTNNFSSTVTPQRVILHFGYLIPFFENYHWFNNVYWTLAVEFQYYFFIALLFIPLINSTLLHRIVIIICILLLSNIGSIDLLLFSLPIFYVGICTFMYIINKISRVEFYLTMLLLFSFSIFKYGWQPVVYITIPIVAILFFRQKKIYGLSFIGKMSYSIYLIHPLIGASFINILSHYVTNGLGKAVIISGGLLVTLISAYFMFLLIEKPSQKLSSSLKYQK